MGLMGQEQAQDNLGTTKAPLRFGLTALVLGNLFLSFGPWFVRMADTGPVASAFWRTALATPVLIALAFVMGRREAPPKAGILWGIFALSGLLFAADLASWHLGILQTKLANANLLGNSTSFLLPLWAFLAARAWPTRMQGAALVLALLGAMMLMGRSYDLSPDNLIGDLLCILAGAFYTAFLVLMARARDSQSPWTILALSTLMTPLPLLAAALWLGEAIMPRDWTPLVLLALSSQIIGQGLMIYVVGRISPVVMGLSLLLQPIVGAALGWIQYGETLAAPDWIGAAMIGLALALVSQPDRKLP